MKPPVYHRITNYDRSLLPNRFVAELDTRALDKTNWHTITGLSPGHPSWGLIYHLFLTMLAPDRFNYIVETGTNWGLSTIIMAQALIDSGRPGEIGTIEIDEKTHARAAEHLKAAGVADRVHQYLGDSLQLLPEVVMKHPSVRMAYLDGNHEKDHVIAEFATVFPRLDEDGIILLDNTASIIEDDEPPRVFEALPEITRRFGGQFVNLPYTSWYTPGMAIWQKHPFAK